MSDHKRKKIKQQDLSIWTVDAFTKDAFAGNPAAVCFIPTVHASIMKNDTLLQTIAREMNLSETAFFTPRETIGDFDLRWFTPTVEVPLCGHATLATAHTIFNHTDQKHNGVLNFHTLSGVLSVKEVDPEEGLLEMDFPEAGPVKVELKQQILNDVSKNLNLKPENVLFTFHSEKTRKLLLEVKSRQDIAQLSLNKDGITSIDFGSHTVKGVIVTTKSEDPKYDCISRYFAPWAGIPEDPVTGSAHTVLAPYWSKKLSKTKLQAFQASERGGELGIDLPGNGRVLLRGYATTVLTSTIHLPVV